MMDIAIDDIQNAYRKTLCTPMGAVVLYDLADYCNFFRTTTGEPSEEAKRDVFLHILEMYGLDSIWEVIQAIQVIPNKNNEVKQDVADSY